MTVIHNYTNCYNVLLASNQEFYNMNLVISRNPNHYYLRTRMQIRQKPTHVVVVVLGDNGFLCKIVHRKLMNQWQ